MESGDEVFHFDLELSDPVYDEESDTLSYTVLSATDDVWPSPSMPDPLNDPIPIAQPIFFEHSQVGMYVATAGTVNEKGVIAVEFRNRQAPW